MRAILRRLLLLVVIVFFVSLFTAFLIELTPGDPVAAVAGFSSEEQRENIRQDLGLDRSFPVRYVKWLGNFATGDFGNYYSVTGGRPVWDTMKPAVPVNLFLMLYAMIITLLLAIPLGVLASYKAGTWIDRVINTTAFGAISIPDFALGLVLVYWLGVRLQWLPVAGYIAPSENLVLHFKSLTIPAISLAVAQVAGYMRLLRSDMIQTLQEDYILMAKAKGMPSRRILWGHALRPSSLTLLTVAGLNIGALIGGAVVLEIIFQLNGVGTIITDAISAKQYVALQSAVALIAFFYVAVNLLVDVLYSVLDPRVRHG